jgi:hypothetical protein
MHQKKDGGPRVHDYVVDEAAKTWTAREVEGETVTPKAEAEKPLKTEKVKTPAPPPSATVGTPPEQKVEDEKPKRKRTPRKKKATVDGFILLVNSVPTKVPGIETVDLSQLLHEEQMELAADKHAKSYFSMDSFDRKDLLKQGIPETVKGLSGKIVYTTARSMEVREYLDALRPFAALVVEGVF